MKKVVFLVAIVATTMLLQSCDAYNSVIDTHNRFVEKHNQVVNEWNSYQQGFNQ